MHRHVQHTTVVHAFPEAHLRAIAACFRVIVSVTRSQGPMLRHKRAAKPLPDNPRTAEHHDRNHLQSSHRSPLPLTAANLANPVFVGALGGWKSGHC
jgi:hypothetical protein